jgi:hypothetical protein
MLRERRARTPKPKPAARPDSRSGYLVLIDQGPLREKATADCAKAMARLERARLGWHCFERKDKPAFIRWRAREFGALLSKAREIEVQIRDSQALVHEVEMEMRRGFQDAHSAYQRVMFRRANPSAAPEEGDEVPREGDTASRRLSDFEKEALFHEWVQRSLGTNPDKMDDDAYSTTFEAFKAHMFRSPLEEARPRNSYRPSPKRHAAAESEEKGEEETRTDARVKELYRILVRRLHPDLRADANAGVSALWHEVQEAYTASDVAQMEILLALSDIESNHVDHQTSVSQMRLLFVELERALRALEKRLIEAEGEDAWNFAQTGPTSDLRMRVERELDSDLAARTLRLEVLTNAIAAWARGPITNRKVRLARVS